jgi:hypothetical protein
VPGVTDGFTKTASKALLLVTLENSKFNGVLLPLRGAKQPGMLTQETPPKPKLVGALLAPLIVTAKVLKLSGANVLAAILTLTVVGAAFTVKLCKTGVAAAYVPLPACEAVIVQVPVRRKVAVLPETAQTLELLEKLTASPELALAVRFSAVPTVCAAIAPKVMVWVFRVPGTVSVNVPTTVVPIVIGIAYVPGVTDGFTNTPSDALLLVTPENSKFNGVLLPVRGTRHPGTLTQETPPKPKLAGALVAPLIVAAKLLKVFCAKVLAAILTLTLPGTVSAKVPTVVVPIVIGMLYEPGTTVAGT